MTFVELKNDSDSSMHMHISSKDSTNCGEKIFRKQIVPELSTYSLFLPSSPKLSNTVDVSRASTWN